MDTEVKMLAGLLGVLIFIAITCIILSDSYERGAYIRDCAIHRSVDECTIIWENN